MIIFLANGHLRGMRAPPSPVMGWKPANTEDLPDNVAEPVSRPLRSANGTLPPGLRPAATSVFLAPAQSVDLALESWQPAGCAAPATPQPTRSTSTARTPALWAIDSQSVRLSDGNPRPPRRPDDGQAIIRPNEAGQNLHPDLVFRVGAAGFEPATPRF